MREVALELLASRTGGIVYVDGADECRAEAGELAGYEGRLVEVGSLRDGGVERQQEDADLTVWKSVSRIERGQALLHASADTGAHVAAPRRSASASRTSPSRTSSSARARSSDSGGSSTSDLTTVCDSLT
jgi:hypothetical protein